MTIESPVRLAAAPSAPRPIRVASVPAAHPYVAAVTASPDIDLRADPVVTGRPEGVWWPPVVLEPDWIDAHASDADVLHIHFGTESFPHGHLTACARAAHGAGWPVVFTVHDLVHPQLVDQTPYLAQLDELMTVADALVTLTTGAAAEIRRRWGRDAAVIGHPSLLRAGAPGPRNGLGGAPRIGVFLTDLRPNVDGPGTVGAVAEAVAILRRRGRAATTDVHMRHDVRDEDARARVRDICARAHGVTLIEHGRLADDDLATAVSALDACVLPYRHGTHSGWLELCWDLGVPVAAPRVGHFLDQHPEGVRGFDRLDPSSLADALDQLLDDDSATPAGSPARDDLVAERSRRRAESDADATRAHAVLYRRLATAVAR